MKQAIIILGCALSLCWLNPSPAEGRTHYTLGIGPVGNIWLFDTFPEMDPGVGGMIFFDYRYHPKFSTEVMVTVTTQDGKGVSALPGKEDGSMEYFGIPTVDFKYYFLGEDRLWDPYVGIGLGFYLMSGGRFNDDSGGAGLGGQIVLGTDYYITDDFSFGFKGSYHSIGLIHSLDGGILAATAVVPYSLVGRLAFHW